MGIWAWPRHGSRMAASTLAIVSVSLLGSVALAAPTHRPMPKPPSHFQTAVAGNITADTTWRRTASPFRVAGPLRVAPGVTLTIEPGVTVAFEPGAELRIEGAVVGEGSADLPIEFLGVDPQAGSWRGIQLLGTPAQPGQLRLSHATIAGAAASASYGGQLYVYQGLVELNSSAIRGGASNGLVVDAGAIHLTDTDITGNAGIAVHIRSLSDAAPSADPTFDNVTISGNGVDAVVIGSGNIAADASWEDLGVPYRLDGQLFVLASATLTIEPGAEVRFGEQGALHVAGNLLAPGTADLPIQLIGSDENAGPWRGISIQGTGAGPANAAFAHVTISGAGRAGAFGAQLTVNLATVELRDSEVLDGGGDGIIVESGGALAVVDTRIAGNAGLPINFEFLAPATDGVSGAPVLENVSIENNGINAIAFGGGTIGADTTWRNMGFPYLVRNQLRIDEAVTLTIEPGVEVQFDKAGELTVAGSIVAPGTADQPIRLIGSDPGAGFWRGIRLLGGGVTPARAKLSHVTLSGAGSSSQAAIDVFNGAIAFTDGTIADNAANGIAFTGGNVSGTIEGSSITDIGGAGIANTTRRVIAAPNNWWGSPTGPTTTDACDEGTGTRIEGLVRFGPPLSAPGQPADPLAAADTATITLVPQRWYAAADGQTRVWVDLTLRDPLGNPMPGQTVSLISTLGSVTNGGITDAAGHTLAYVTSTEPGDANLQATLKATGDCQKADGTEVMVTFTDDADTLLGGMQAPYMYDGIDINPEPVTRGVPTTITALITNPNDAPITVEANFEFVNSGIGLAFGPVGQPQVKQIPAGGEQTFETTFTPVVTGHYCVQVLYRIVAGAAVRTYPPVAMIDGRDLLTPARKYQGGGGGRGQRNLNIFGGGLGSGGGGGPGGPGPKPDLEKAKNAGAAVGRLGGAATIVPRAAAGVVTGQLYKHAATISQQMGGDPPRQDYKIVAQPQRRPLPPAVRADGVSDAGFAAQVALDEALAEFVAIGDAATVTLDRYGGAAAAANLEWASVQASSLLYYRKQLGAASNVVADKIAALAAVIEAEGGGNAGLTLDEAVAAQARLAADGYTPAELEAAHALGFTDEQIEAARQIDLSLKPEDLAGPIVAKLAAAEEAFRGQGAYLIEPVNFAEEPGREGLSGQFLLAGVALTGENSNLARIYEHSSTIQIGNPLDHEATIELRLRPISIPVGWQTEVSVDSITLKPGEEATVTVSISATTPAAQGSMVKLAVEGYAEGQLLGGVVVAVLVPNYVPFGELPGASPPLPLIALVAGAAVLLLVVFVIALLFIRRRRGGRPAEPVPPVDVA
jgi:hypothetical protein